MALLVIILIIALKFLLPVLFLWFPFVAGWSNWILDSIDGDMLIPAGLSDPVYQNIDKTSDWVTYLMIFIWAWRRPIRREIAAAFVLRTIGQGAFFITQDEIVFFYFPNLIEPLFLVYVTIARFKGWDAVQGIYRRRWVWIWLGILVYKFQDEYFTHVANVDRTDWLRGLLN